MTNHHLSEDMLEAFKLDQLKDQELLQFLEHASTCDFCSQQLADCMKETMLTAPQGMKENLLKESNEWDVKLKHRVKTTTKQMELFFYSMKVGAATVGALIVLFMVMNMWDISRYSYEAKTFPIAKNETTSITTNLRDNINQFSNQIFEFSNSIIKTEDFNYEKKEK